MERNPLLEPEDYMKDYQKSIEALKNQPAVIEFDKLCYELFEGSEIGQRFIELVLERYLIPAIAKCDNPYQVIWGEGFKDFPRMLISSLKAHQQRIEAGKNK